MENEIRNVPPKFVPLRDDDVATSSVSMTVVGGPSVNLWSASTPTEGETLGELKLELQPDEAIVVGRQEGGRIEYLDPNYRPTQLVPNSSRRVVENAHADGPDNFVSRGHFMLKGSPHGIRLVNGVPRLGGGIRPPVNGTIMLEPHRRTMIAGEDYVIERGASATIRLPNGTIISLRAA